MNSGLGDQKNGSSIGWECFWAIFHVCLPTLYIKHDGTLGSLSIWHVDCEPGTEIKTDATYSDGEPVFLRCHDEGGRLIHQVSWTSGETDPYWSFDYGGFSISEDFSEWDFTELERESSILRATKPQMAGESSEDD